MHPTHTAVSAAINPEAAQHAVARAMAAAGSETEWNSQTIEFVMEALERALPASVPAPTDSSPAAVAFWAAVAHSDGQ